jgi:hypothetical protein
MKNTKAIQIIQVISNHIGGSSSHKRTVRTSIFKFKTLQTSETPLCHLVSRKKESKHSKDGNILPRLT